MTESVPVEPPALAACPMCGAAIRDARRTCPECGEILAATGPVRILLDGLWRDGKRLVMEKGAQLPALCVKSGRPADGWLKRKLMWIPMAPRLIVAVAAAVPILTASEAPWLGVAVASAQAVAALAMFKLARRETIEVGLSQEVFRQRLRWTILSWVAGAVGGVLIVAGIATLHVETVLWIEFLSVGLLAMIASAFCYSRAAVVYATQITRRHIWLAGVHRDLVDSLPKWPGERALPVPPES